MVLKGNKSVLEPLRDFYQKLLLNDEFTIRNDVSPDVKAFVAQVDTFIYDINMQIERGNLIAQNIVSRKTMVSGNGQNLLTRINSHAIDPSTSTKPSH